MSSFKRNMVFFCETSKDTSYLCNSFRAKFSEKGKCFPTIEHYLAHNKAKLAGDLRMGDVILMTDDVELARKFGESIINHDEAKWQRLHFQILWSGIYFKSMQNKKLRIKLILALGRKLVYANGQDSFYGNGTDPELKVSSPFFTNSFNILGSTLMDVREPILTE